MIVFQTSHQEMYNHIIHNFLDIEVFNGITDLGDIAEEIVPTYLFREQYQKCLEVLKNLYYWTEDNFTHEMSAFHELMLYKFINYMEDIAKNTKDFNKIYFNKETMKLIKKAATEEYEYNNEFSVEENIKYFCDISNYIDDLFIDTDFNFLDKIYNLRNQGNIILEERLGINIDFYYEILPLDIQKKYQTKHITLKSEVEEMLTFFQRKIYHGSLYKLFWKDDKPVNEVAIQVILENLMEAYFYKRNVEISREVLIGNGKVDFKLYKNDDTEEKVLIEVKRANNPRLKSGIDDQLTEYLKSCDYRYAFYLIVCYTDEEYNKVYNFINNHTYTESTKLYISMNILDVRKRVATSKITSNKKKAGPIYGI